MAQDRDRWWALANAVRRINITLGRVRFTIVAVEEQQDNDIKCVLNFSTIFFPKLFSL